MFQVTYWGFRYARLIAESKDQEKKIEALKKSHSYIQVGSYQLLTLPGFLELQKKAVSIDLTPPIETIFKHFKDTSRNEINRTYKIEGLRFVPEDTNYTELQKLHRSFDLKRGWMPAPQAELKESLVFSAYFKDTPISVITCFSGTQTLRILELFSARYDTTPECTPALISYATRRLVYEICTYAKKKGYTSFDLGGINLEDPSKAGVAQFKQSFGGTIIDVYFYLYTTPAFRIFKKILTFFRIDIPA
jgi:hypothetical protein